MSKESLDYNGGGKHENLRGWGSTDKSYFVGKYFDSISPIFYIVFWEKSLVYSPPPPPPFLVLPALDYKSRYLGRSENLEGGSVVIWWAKFDPLDEIGLPAGIMICQKLGEGGSFAPPNPSPVPTALRRTSLSGNLILTSSAGRGALFLPYMGT